MVASTLQLPSSFKVGGKEIKPVVDTDECRAHLLLLRRFHELRVAVEADSSATDAFETFVRGAAARFNEWVQAGHASETPALDVAMVWHAFMLNPSAFAKDVENLPALASLDSFPLFTIAHSKDSIAAIVRKAQGASTATHLPFSIDVAAAVIRQASFIKNVVELGWTKDIDEKGDLLVRAVARYHAFLDLLVVRPDVLATPTMDIDLAWHTHQLKGKTYRADTVRITGKLIDHDDTVDEEELNGTFDETADVWQAHFGVSYTGSGASDNLLAFPSPAEASGAGCRRRPRCHATEAGKNAASAGCYRPPPRCRPRCHATEAGKDSSGAGCYRPPPRCHATETRKDATSAGCRRAPPPPPPRCRRTPTCRRSCHAE